VHGVRTSIVRIFNTFGPRMRADDGRAIPTFVQQGLSGEPLTVAGDGSQTRSVCFVSDLVEGITRLLESGHPGPMNIGNPDEMTILKLAELVRELTGSRSEITHMPIPVDDPQRRRPDITLARQELGWQPEVALKTGLTTTIDWFEARQARSRGTVG
jgi:dTDP-glucose 4,6-dehydratase